MTPEVQMAIIAAVPPTIMATASLVVSLRNHRATKDIHLAMNSRFDEWMEATKRASFAEGVKSEMEKRIDRIAGDR